ncbi:helix-turn-helix transcriptional regulator [Chitinimonas arctica]|nr:AraC family transcriptional regulator [Chitinimonas arctica]
MTVQLILFKQASEVRVKGELHTIQPNSLVLTDDKALIASDTENWKPFVFHVGDFQDLYLGVIDLLDDAPVSMFKPAALRQIQVDEALINVALLLAEASPAAMLHFIYAYCLGCDKTYFTALLKQCVAGDQGFFDFIEANFCKPWTVTQFADELGLPVRKLNFLFHEKFGMSAKHWLLERRLNLARKLLLTTEMRVIDIAFECGFSNHAHFTDSFKKRYQRSPTELRQGRQPEVNTSFDLAPPVLSVA